MSDRVIAITGAFGVLGSAVAAAAGQRGFKVALIDMAKAPASLPADVLALGGVDLTRAEEADRAMAAIQARFGGLHALLNIAGGFRWTTLADSDPALWRALFDMNVQTTANASRAATPLLKASGSGRIVNVGAGAAEKAAAGMGVYAASKAGVHRLTEALAEELKGEVTVNAVLPSIIDTPTNRSDMPKADFSTWVRPSELAELMLFLASEGASAVTGALIRVPGRV